MNSDGDIKTMIAISVHRTEKRLRVEKWEIAPPDKEHPDPKSPIARLIHEVIVQPEGITGPLPLVIPLENILLRSPVLPDESDILFTAEDLLQWARVLWGDVRDLTQRGTETRRRSSRLQQTQQQPQQRPQQQTRQQPQRQLVGHQPLKRARPTEEDFPANPQENNIVLTSMYLPIFSYFSIFLILFLQVIHVIKFSKPLMYLPSRINPQIPFNRYSLMLLELLLQHRLSVGITPVIRTAIAISTR